MIWRADGGADEKRISPIQCIISNIEISAVAKRYEKRPWFRAAGRSSGGTTKWSKEGPGNLGQRKWPLQYLRFTYVYKGWAQISPLTLHQRFPSFQR